MEGLEHACLCWNEMNSVSGGRFCTQVRFTHKAWRDSIVLYVPSSINALTMLKPLVMVPLDL